MITLNLDLNDEGARYDSGFDDSGPFADTPPPGGVALDAALGEFGPAALDDLIPRLRVLAAVLDQAHAAGFVHGRLHPSKILVTNDGTYVMGRRVPASGIRTREADQYALATIAYEWMFGRPPIKHRSDPDYEPTGAGDRPVDVRSLPGVDRTALSRAFTRALSPEPSRRFGSCADFVDAIAESVMPSLPLMAGDDDADPVGPFMPERPEPMAIEPEPDLVINPVVATESAFAAAEETPAASADRQGERFSGLALILAAIVGMVAGFAAGYMARPRALQSRPPTEMAAGTDNDLRTAAPSAPPLAPEARKAPTPAPKAPAAPQAPTKVGRLLVRSTPSGANVEVDGVARGVTPLALRDLDLGAREITVTRRGYVPEERRIVLTKARPSRSVEVRMTGQAAAASASAAEGRSGAIAPERARRDARAGGPPRPSTPASLGKVAVSTGVLAVESRPVGASVTVNGKPSGHTPLTINDLPPGDYRVTMSLPGYRNVATTVRVVAGERARAAARLTEQEQE